MAKLNATETKGKVLKNEVRKAEKPPPKAKGPKVAKPKKQVQKQKKEAEKDLPALAEAAAQKKKATSGCGCGTATNSGGAKPKGSKGGGTCIDIGTEVRFLGKRENLGQSRVGRRIKGEGKLPRKEPDCELMRLVRLELDYGDGNGLEAELLRGVDWLANHQAVEGSVLWLDLPEVGLSGWASVRTIEGCPGLEKGEGPLVTGWFKHRSGTVYDLVIAGEAKRIGITGTHPVWSVDRQDWVPAAELEEEGERLLADDGSTPVVVSLSLRGCNEPVYNIEADGDHCYRVGQQGLLVHNASPGEQGTWVESCNPGVCADLPAKFPPVSEPHYENLEQVAVSPAGRQRASSSSHWGFYLGRPKGAHIVYLYGHTPSGSRRGMTDIQPPGWDPDVNAEEEATIIAKGHLLAASLGGGVDVRNLVTICHLTTNIRWHKEIEDEIRRKSKEDKLVFYYEVRAHYAGATDAIPDYLQVRACAQDAKGRWYRTKDSFWIGGVPNLAGSGGVRSCETKPKG